MSSNHYASVVDANAAADFSTTTGKQHSTSKHSEPLILKLFQLGFKIGGLLSPSLTSRLAYNLWLTPPRFKTPASEQKALEAAELTFFQVNNQNIATYRWGATTAPMILLVHGWSGRGTQMGSLAQPLLDAGYQVLSFDAPAHGKSDGKQTNLYQIADVILALQALYGQFDAIITHSFGGPCTAVAVQRGLKAKRIVSICPPATTIGLIEKFVSALHITEKTSAKLMHRIKAKFGEHILKDTSMINTVKYIDIPGLVIHDVHDTDVAWEEGQAVAYAWNNAPFKITNGLGHRRILRDKDVIESAISFIAK